MYRGIPSKKKINTRKIPKRKPCRYGKYFQKLQEQEKANTFYWENVLETLTNMKKDLETLGNVPKKSVDAIKYTVELFNIVSLYQDMLEGEIKKCPAKKYDYISIFNECMFFAGRHTADERFELKNFGEVPYWNITAVGENVTMSNLMLGGEFGTVPRPASYWIKLSKSKKCQVPISGKVSKYSSPMWMTDALVKYLIYGFSKDLVKDLLESIDQILA